jgi:hypothetical protein
VSRAQDEAASPLVGLLIAAVVFSVAFGVLLSTSVDRDPGTIRSQVAGLETTASVLARSLLREPGEGWYDGAACADGQPNGEEWQPDGVLRAGLGEETCAIHGGSGYHRLSYEKLSNLVFAQIEGNASNGALDYEEARESLGLAGTTTHFHLRSWPLLPPLDRRLELGQGDANLRALYVGDYNEVHGGVTETFLVEHLVGALDLGTAAQLYVNVTNNGTSPTAFTVTFTVPTTRSIIVEKHTGELASGAHQNVTLLVNKTAGWTWKNASDPHFEYAIRDPSKTVGEGRAAIAFPLTSGATRPILVLEAAQLEYQPHGGSANLDFVYDALDGSGDSNVANPGWSLRLRDPTGTIVSTATDLKDKGGTRSFTVSGTGTYHAELLDPGSDVVQADDVNVVASSLPRFEPEAAAGQWTPTASVLPEATFLDALLASFDLSVRDAAYVSPGISLDSTGDVFPDDNRYLSDALPTLLRNATGAGSVANYNILVVGSNVDHNTLTSGNVKYPIRDWVEAGGTLVVLGSDEQAVQWLEPLFHTGLQLAGGGIGIPDPDHPILTTPNQLDIVALDDHGTAWRFNHEEEGSLFTHVVKAGQDDVLGVSNPGAFGLGRVILTSWQAFDAVLGDPQAACAPGALTPDCAGLQMLDNFITLAYRPLYIDYGPAIPTGGAVASATDIGIVFSPSFAQSIEVYVVLYVFD